MAVPVSSRARGLAAGRFARRARRAGGVGRVRRDRARRPVLHLGHDRRAQGRDLHPPLELSPHRPPAPGRRHRAAGKRRGARGGADVPRQRLGPAVRRPRGRGETRPARPPAGRREPRPADHRRAGHGGGGRRDGVARTGRSSRPDRRRGAVAAPPAARRRAAAAGADGPARGPPRGHRPDQLGDDRTVAARHRHPGRGGGAPRVVVGTAGDRRRPAPDRRRRGAAPRAARRRGPSPRARREHGGALLRRRRAGDPTPRAGSIPAISRRSTPPATSPSPGAPRT